MPMVITLKEYCALAADARAAFRMVEQHAPSGAVPAEEAIEPPFTKEAEVLVKGVLAIVSSKR